MSDMGSGESYAGEFKYGDYQGQGVYVWPDGSMYVGGFNTNDLQAEGILVKVERELVFIGEWKKGLSWETIVFDFSGEVWGTTSGGVDCRGCNPQSNQNLALGPFKEFSSIPWEGGTYIGALFKGNPHGLGWLTAGLGGQETASVIGEWRHGYPNGLVFIFMSFGEQRFIYRGEFSNVGAHGRGVLHGFLHYGRILDKANEALTEGANSLQSALT